MILSSRNPLPKRISIYGKLPFHPEFLKAGTEESSAYRDWVNSTAGVLRAEANGPNQWSFLFRYHGGRETTCAVLSPSTDAVNRSFPISVWTTVPSKALRETGEGDCLRRCAPVFDQLSTVLGAVQAAQSVAEFRDLAEKVELHWPTKGEAASPLISSDELISSLGEGPTSEGSSSQSEERLRSEVSDACSSLRTAPLSEDALPPLHLPLGPTAQPILSTAAWFDLLDQWKLLPIREDRDAVSLAIPGESTLPGTGTWVFLRSPTPSDGRWLNHPSEGLLPFDIGGGSPERSGMAPTNLSTMGTLREAARRLLGR